MSDTTDTAADTMDTNSTALGGDSTTDQPAPEDSGTPKPEGQDKPDGTEQADKQTDTGEQDKDKADDKGDKPKDDAEPAPYDPEKLELPDGFELDQQMMEQFNPLAEELGLGQEQAQKLISMHTEALKAQQQAAADQQAEQSQQWAEQARTDDEFGGQAYTQNLQAAKKAMDQFGTPELKQLMDQTGLGNHPELIRVFVRAGKAMSEDTFSGGPSGAQEKRTEDVMYNGA